MDRQTDIYVASIGSYRVSEWSQEPRIQDSNTQHSYTQLILFQNENVIQRLAGRGPVYDYRDYVINVDYSRRISDITNELMNKICSNMNNLRP